jgi:hypothetical protein
VVLVAQAVVVLEEMVAQVYGIGVAGTVNTGGGGGGGSGDPSAAGGAGGSGIVIVRYAV